MPLNVLRLQCRALLERSSNLRLRLEDLRNEEQRLSNVLGVIHQFDDLVSNISCHYVPLTILLFFTLSGRMVGVQSSRKKPVSLGRREFPTLQRASFPIVLFSSSDPNTL
jgi:hypothetical protein